MFPVTNHGSKNWPIMVPADGLLEHERFDLTIYIQIFQNAWRTAPGTERHLWFWHATKSSPSLGRGICHLGGLRTFSTPLIICLLPGQLTSSMLAFSPHPSLHLGLHLSRLGLGLRACSFPMLSRLACYLLSWSCLSWASKPSDPEFPEPPEAFCGVTLSTCGWCPPLIISCQRPACTHSTLRTPKP